MKAVWLCPNLNANVSDLFAYPVQWPRSRNATSIIMLETPELENWAQGAKNAWSVLAAVGAVAKLKDWSIKLAVNAGVVKPQYMANQVQAVMDTQAMISHVESTGGTLDFVSMDSPIFDGLQSGLDINATVGRTADYVKAVKAFRPATQVGLTFSYPSLTAAQHAQALDGLIQAGAKPDFCHLDIDFSELAGAIYAGALARDLPLLRSNCIARSIPCGVIMWPGGPATDSQDWCDKTIANAKQIRDLIGMPEHVVVESWDQGPGRNLPQVLPEKAQGTQTKCLNDIMELFQ